MAQGNQGPAADYDGPPDYRAIGRHGVFPEITHDEAERFNLLAHMNRHLATRVLPGVKSAFDARVAPAFRAEHGRDFADRHEVRRALMRDPYARSWSALRRATMEMRQQAGRWVTLRQQEALRDRAADFVDADDAPALDPAMRLPRYITAIDHHCMPGSYHTDGIEGGVANAANYDSGLFATTGGGLGRYSDGGGQAVVRWVRRTLPDFAPKRILDVGAGLGHSVLPLAQAFPDAEVIAIDVGAPMLRYGHARARSLGVANIRFVQADAANLSAFADDSFDWVQSTMFLHETSAAALPRIFAETRRVLAPGGIVLHAEQPQYTADMPLFEQAMRDWDAFYNNEPFWTKLHEIDLDETMRHAGFTDAELIHGQVTAVVDRDIFPDAADDTGEDYGRKAAWHVIGARKAA